MCLLLCCGCRAAGGRDGSSNSSSNNRPVVGVLKLSPEKGCSIVLSLARLLPCYSFLAVAGDPEVARQVQEAGLHNFEVRV